MPLVYGQKRIITKTVHGGQIGTLLTGLLSNGGQVALKGVPKKALKILGPLVLRLLTPLLLHGVDKVKETRDKFLTDKSELVKGAATLGSDAVLDTAVNELLNYATQQKKAKGIKVPLEMRKMLNKRSELILNNLLK